MTKAALSAAYANFDNATDPDLIDCYIYQLNSEQKRYKYLLQRLKNRKYILIFRISDVYYKYGVPIYILYTNYIVNNFLKLFFNFLFFSIFVYLTFVYSSYTLNTSFIITTEGKYMNNDIDKDILNSHLTMTIF